MIYETLYWPQNNDSFLQSQKHLEFFLKTKQNKQKKVLLVWLNCAL